MPYDSHRLRVGGSYYINIVLWAVAPHLCSEVLRQQKFLQSHTLVHFSNIAVGLVRFYFRWCNSLPATSTPLTANSTGSFHSHSSDRGILTAWAQLSWWMESSPVTWGINCMMETCILCGLQGKARLGIASAVGSNKDSACHCLWYGRVIGLGETWLFKSKFGLWWFCLLWQFCFIVHLFINAKMIQFRHWEIYNF